MTKGERLRKRRIELGLTLEEVSKKLNVTRQTIQRYESGVINTIPSDKIELLAKVLKTTPLYIMGWEDGIEKKEDKRIDNLNTEELSQLDKILNETTLFFNAEDVTDEDKILLRKALIEVFFDVLNKNKKK